MNNGFENLFSQNIVKKKNQKKTTEMNIESCQKK